MSSRDSWVPIVAGVVLGAGLLVALYQLLANRGPKYENQQIGAKFVCTCNRPGQDWSMSSRDSWVPIVAGVVLGAGLLAALSHLLNRNSKCKIQMKDGRAVCICKPGCQNLCQVHEYRRKI